jgi:hypothetical protein
MKEETMNVETMLNCVVCGHPVPEGEVLAEAIEQGLDLKNRDKWKITCSDKCEKWRVAEKYRVEGLKDKITGIIMTSAFFGSMILAGFLGPEHRDNTEDLIFPQMHPIRYAIYTGLMLFILAQVLFYVILMVVSRRNKQ